MIDLKAILKIQLCPVKDFCVFRKMPLLIPQNQLGDKDFCSVPHKRLSAGACCLSSYRENDGNDCISARREFVYILLGRKNIPFQGNSLNI